MLEKFYPDNYISSVYTVDYEKLYEEGYQGVLYDIDNTLVLHDAAANMEAKKLFERIHAAGLKIALVSNNHIDRVRSFAESAGADSYVYDSHKPSKMAYLKAVDLLGLNKDSVIFFGDQLFTDVWGARNAEIRSVLVKPIGKEKLLQIKVKRWLEKPILLSYLRKVRNNKIKVKDLGLIK